MKKNKFLLLLVSCLVPAALIGCASAPVEKDYPIEPDDEHKITYLLTNFEAESHRNAEGIYRGNNPMGYHYTFDDPKSLIDDTIPHAAESPSCKDADGEDRVPYPVSCGITEGFQINQTNPFNYFKSEFSFHLTGVTAGEGVGFGTYFSDYVKLGASGGRKECGEDADLPDWYAEKYDFYKDQTDTDIYEYASKMKESRCLGKRGQKGFVMWATGNATVEVTLNMPQTAPMADGGLCDDDGGEKCYDFHKVKFKLDGAWREYWADWSEFKQEGWGTAAVLDPDSIINIQIKVVPPDNGGFEEFDIWLDHIGFYGGETWDFVNELADTQVEIIDTATIPQDTTPVDTTPNDTGTGTDTNTGTDTGTDTNTDTETDTGTDTDTGTETGTDTTTD